jgi:hypothetical protein
MPYPQSTIQVGRGAPYTDVRCNVTNLRFVQLFDATTLLLTRCQQNLGLLHLVARAELCNAPMPGFMYIYDTRKRWGGGGAAQTASGVMLVTKRLI